jgi:hypothetical protein
MSACTGRADDLFLPSELGSTWRSREGRREDDDAGGWMTIDRESCPLSPGSSLFRGRVWTLQQRQAAAQM